MVLLVIALGVSGTNATANNQVSRRDADALSQASLIYIATVRKDGNQSTAAPVWFTTSSEGVVLIQTAPQSWKAKRIRRGSPVIVWIGERNGPAFVGRAQITSEPAIINRIVTDYPKKYLLAWIGLHRPTNERFMQKQIIAIKIYPLRDLPAGYQCSPGTPAPDLTGRVSAQTPTARVGMR